MAKGVAIVTGSSQGLGKAIAARLSRDGFPVVINDIAAKQDQIDAVVKEIKESGGTAIGIAADVTHRAEVQSLVDKATEQLGPLEVMVANAGLAHADAIFDLTEEHVQRILNVNISGVFNCYVVAGKKMVEQGKGGKLIAATSVAAFRGFSFVSAYTASKWAVRGLTQVCVWSSQEARDGTLMI
jgi:meso-butanediol dehydrogenase/(S,S)-butanediol dehydrogenase/diacetyl reductase